MGDSAGKWAGVSVDSPVGDSFGSFVGATDVWMVGNSVGRAEVGLGAGAAVGSVVSGKS